MPMLSPQLIKFAHSRHICLFGNWGHDIDMSDRIQLRLSMNKEFSGQSITDS